VLNAPVVVREHWFSTDTALFDADPYTVTPLGGDGEIEDMPSMHRLVLVYVHRRAAAGQINKRTATVLRSRLTDFADHAPANPKRVYRRHVEQWMERPELRPQYRRARLSALRGFTKWCVAEGYMVKDPTLTVPMPKVGPQLPKRLTHDEATKLVDATSHDLRLRLIVLLMLQEGLRRIEVSRLNVEDVDWAERSMVIRGKGGQGCETDSLPITDETWRALDAYLASEGHSHGPLIRNKVRAHGRMAATSISELVRAAMVDAGIKRPGDRLRTPHSTRHTMAHDVLSRTSDVRAVQQALRHRSVRSTEVYLRGQTSELRGIMGGRHYAS
jgi:integrase